MEICLCSLSPSIGLFFKYLSFHLINISSWNHGKKNESTYGYVSPCLLCNMNNILPMQYDSTANATAQPEHRSTSLSMMILGPVHASNSCHTIHHKEKYMSKMNRES
jgi:hypothetical protein